MRLQHCGCRTFLEELVGSLSTWGQGPRTPKRCLYTTIKLDFVESTSHVPASFLFVSDILSFWNDLFSLLWTLMEEVLYLRGILIIFWSLSSCPSAWIFTASNLCWSLFCALCILSSRITLSKLSAGVPFSDIFLYPLLFIECSFHIEDTVSICWIELNWTFYSLCHSFSVYICQLLLLITYLGIFF